MKYRIFCGLFLFAQWAGAQDQTAPFTDTTYQGGAWARREIVDGDTTFVMSLRPVRISAKRNFKDRAEQHQFRMYTKAAKNVYPYALQAVSLYNQIQEETQDMSKRKRKRHIRHEHKELKGDMTDKMKDLSRTEGKVLIKMIERQLGMPFYEVIRETRGGATAAYWNTLGKIWGYDLKEGYRLGSDPLLDEVLQDYMFGEAVWLY